MELWNILWSLLGLTALSLLVSLGWLLLRWAAESGDNEVRSVERVFSLAPGAFSRSASWTLTTGEASEEIVRRVCVELQAVGARVLRSDRSQAALRLPIRSEQVWQAGARKLPTRIVLEVSSAHDAGGSATVLVRIRLDEDYGLRTQAGIGTEPAKWRRFRAGYDDAFDRILCIVRQALVPCQADPSQTASGDRGRYRVPDRHARSN